MTGLAIGILGLALCAALCGVGSSYGLRATTSATSGILAEDPSQFSKLMVLTLLPATQGLYGFVIAIMGMGYLTTSIPALASAAELAVNVSANAANITAGWNIFFAVLPMAITGLITGIVQGQVAAASILSVSKKPEIGGKAILFPAMIEFYALLGMVISIMLLGALPVV